VDELSKIPPSPLDENFDMASYAHYGSGSLNVNSRLGVQKNNTNSGPGTQFIADTLHYGAMSTK
jgi:hypothetical protein